MAKRVTICLIGPKNGGKTSLLASAVDCVMQSAHGYPSDLRPAIQSITRAEFEGADAGAPHIDILDGHSEEYQELRREFAKGCAPTDALPTHEYFFRVTLNGIAPAEALEEAPYLVEVMDSGGDIAIPDDNAPNDIPQKSREEFSARLLKAEAIILVMPLVRLEDSGWIVNVARLFERLANAPEKNLKRVVVAFSQYERLFARFGPSAFTYACDPAVALYVLRNSLRTAQWMDSLRSLEAGANKVAVRFTVASSFGFVKIFQNPNVDPHQAGERRFRRSGIEGPRALNEFWRPFLTADPLLFSALELDSAFTFSYAQIDGAQSEPNFEQLNAPASS
jgi:hypothetical protein